LQENTRAPASATPSDAPRGHRLYRHAAIVSLMTLISRISGLLQSMFLAHFLGAGAAADAFFVAFRLPNLLRRFTAEGTMTAAFLPAMAEVESQDGEAAMRRAAARFLGTLASLLALFTIVVVMGMGAVVGVLVLGRLRPAASWSQQLGVLASVLTGAVAPPAEMALTTTLARVMFPYLVLVSLTAGFAALLNFKHRFALAASVSTFWNIAFIAFAWAALALGAPSVASSPERTALVCSVAVLVGGIVQLALIWPAARRLGFGVAPGLHLKDAAVRRTLGRMGPGLLAAGIYPINTLLSTVLASKLPDGAQTVLFNSGMMGEMVLGVFAMGLATASLPLLSRQSEAGNLAGMRETLGSALRATAILVVPASVGMALLARPIVTLIFERGRYDAAAAEWTAATLAFQCLGLLFAASHRIGVQALYALKDYRAPVVAAVVALVANIVLSLVLLGPLGTRGLALATGIASLLGMACAGLFLEQRLGQVPFGSVAAAWVRMLLAAAPMGLVAFGGARVLHLSAPMNRLSLSLRLFPLIGLCAVVYGGLLLVLRDADAIDVSTRMLSRVRSLGRRQP
jgi:putative peptidoglycan lipid II flippase